jgi:hypothetical protein
LFDLFIFYLIATMTSPVQKGRYRNSEMFNLRTGSGQMDAAYLNGTYQVKKTGSELVCEACWKIYQDSGTHQQKCPPYATLNRMMNKALRIDYEVDPNLFRIMIDEHRDGGPIVPYSVLMNQEDAWNLDDPIVVPPSIQGEHPSYEGKSFVQLMDGLKKDDNGDNEHNKPNPIDIYALAAKTSRDDHCGYKKHLLRLGEKSERDYKVITSEVIKNVASCISGNGTNFITSFVNKNLTDPRYSSIFVKSTVSNQNTANVVADAFVVTPGAIKKLLNNQQFRDEVVKELLGSRNFVAELTEVDSHRRKILEGVIDFGKNNPSHEDVAMLNDHFPKRARTNASIEG